MRESDLKRKTNALNARKTRTANRRIKIAKKSAPLRRRRKNARFFLGTSKIAIKRQNY